MPWLLHECSNGVGHNNRKVTLLGSMLNNHIVGMKVILTMHGESTSHTQAAIQSSSILSATS
jgi:hypothetical protein